MNSAVDRFYMKKSAVRFGKLLMFVLIGFGLFSVFFSFNLFGGSVAAALCMLVIGALFIAGGYRGLTRGRGVMKFIEITPQGLNINNEKSIAWGDITKVEEGETEEDYQYVSVKKKTLIISHLVPATGKTAVTRIISDYENYPVIREKIFKITGKG